MRDLSRFFRLFKISVLALALGSVGSALGESGECLKVKAAFDIGSGATKMKVARVDTCLQKIDKILYDSHEAVKYKESLQNNPKNILNQSILKKGVSALLKLKAKANEFAPDAYEAVATSAFRTAANGEEAAKFIMDQTKIDFKIISQKDEAKLGFYGATRVAETDIQNLVVWDIGGGSMQISAYTGGGQFEIFQGKMASASFKKHIIKEIQGKDPLKVETPNPMGQSVSNKAWKSAMEMAQSSVPDSIKSKIKQGAQVVGIGGVHYYSVRGQTGVQSKYQIEDLNKALSKGSQMSDAELKGDYSSTDVSNLALVKGFMKGLGIKEVMTGKINLADGILLGGLPK